MNKYQEAKTNIVNTLVRVEGFKAYRNLYDKSFTVLQELVDKEEPKKPIKDYSINKKYPMIKFEYICPNCNKGLVLWYDEEPGEYDVRCSICGQVIDWSDENE